MSQGYEYPTPGLIKTGDYLQYEYSALAYDGVQILKRLGLMGLHESPFSPVASEALAMAVHP